jgi:hypothetical protein
MTLPARGSLVRRTSAGGSEGKMVVYAVATAARSATKPLCARTRPNEGKHVCERESACEVKRERWSERRSPSPAQRVRTTERESACEVKRERWSERRSPSPAQCRHCRRPTVRRSRRRQLRVQPMRAVRQERRLPHHPTRISIQSKGAKGLMKPQKQSLLEFATGSGETSHTRRRALPVMKTSRIVTLELDGAAENGP